MTIVIDDSVWVRLKDLLTEDKCLRMGIESGGCYGFQYVFAVDSTLEPDDVVFTHGRLKVVVHKKYMPFLDGGTLVFEKEMMRAQFAFHNPKTTQGCGCGISFSISKESS